jgi:hypothetical protein
MQIKDSTYISYAGTAVKEAWLNDTLVWQASSFGWILRPLARAAWSDVGYGPTDTLVAVGNNRSSYSTDNGDTWSAVTTPINATNGIETYNAVCYGSNNNTWVLIESQTYSPYGSKYFYTSNNLADGWTSNTLNYPLSTLDYYDVLYSSYHNKYIAIGSKNSRVESPVVGMYSTDAINWLPASYLSYDGIVLSDNQGFYGGIIEGTNMPNNRLVASGYSGDHKFGYSDDGITWKQGRYDSWNSPLGQNLRTGHNWVDVTYGYDGNVSLPLSGRYVAVNINGSTSEYQFAYSDDGIGWIGVKYTSSELKKNWSTIAYGNGYFVALAGNSQAMSKDGKSWLAYQNLPSGYNYVDVEVANNRFVAVLSTPTSTNVGCSTADFIF